MAEMIDKVREFYSLNCITS